MVLQWSEHVQWVVNYNVLLRTKDMQGASSIAKAVSSRGGGLDCVEAMALQHEEGVLALCSQCTCEMYCPGSAQLSQIQADYYLLLARLSLCQYPSLWGIASSLQASRGLGLQVLRWHATSLTQMSQHLKQSSSA